MTDHNSQEPIEVIVDAAPPAGDAGAGAPPPFDTHYEERTGAAWFTFDPVECLNEAASCVRDTVLKVVPVEVTEHLGNSQREFILAGVALAESGIRSIDSVLKHARDLNEKKAPAAEV